MCFHSCYCAIVIVGLSTGLILRFLMLCSAENYTFQILHKIHKIYTNNYIFPMCAE